MLPLNSPIIIWAVFKRLGYILRNQEIFNFVKIQDQMPIAHALVSLTLMLQSFARLEISQLIKTGREGWGPMPVDAACGSGAGHFLWFRLVKIEHERSAEFFLRSCAELFGLIDSRTRGT